MRHHVVALTSALVALATNASLPAVAADPPAHIRGTIVAIAGTVLSIQTARGRVKVMLGPKTGYAGASSGSIADIKPGRFVGIASVPSGSASKALEVAVFPESLRGRGEGDYPWDLSAGGSHSAMTNGTVAMGASKAHSTMTNGTVAMGAPKAHSMMTNGSVSKTSGNGTNVTLAYKGGSRSITIPANATIVKLAPGSRTLLVMNAHVFVVPKKSGGGNTAAFVIVGQNGTIPPM